MKIRVNRYDEEAKTVDVSFVAEKLKHRRQVNAVVAEDGSIDRSATAARLEEVARGVEAKIQAGILSA